MNDEDDNEREGHLVWKREAQEGSEEPQPAEEAQAEDSASEHEASQAVGITSRGWFNRRPPNRGK